MMKNQAIQKLLIGTAISMLVSNCLLAQYRYPDIYASSGFEYIFSFADVSNQEYRGGNVMRFAPFFNSESLVNIDLSPSFGFFTGMGIRNVGFIYDLPNSGVRKKYRTYNVGLPLGVKLGNMNRLFMFGGYSLEFPVNYKEKTFEDEVKVDKFSVWLSDRTPRMAHGWFAGVQFPYGMSIRVKYYLNNFFNKQFTQTVDGVLTQPFANLNVHVFYLSLSFHLFRNTRWYSSPSYRTSSSPIFTKTI
jgi:hypothetical protein